MPFQTKVAEVIAYRSGYICNNPDCNVLTIGPSCSDPLLRTKAGEAAHIVGEKPGSARYEKIDPVFVQSAGNGLWLCVVCHTLIDKNDGVDYPSPELFKWKESHETLMMVLLRTHRSPLPLIRRHGVNAKIAQDIVDTLSNQGVMFQPYAMEDPNAVIKSTDHIRKRLQRCLSQIDLDLNLRQICQALIHAFRDLMNENSRDASRLGSYLEVLRGRAGVQLYRLKNEYGCIISGPITMYVQ